MFHIAFYLRYCCYKIYVYWISKLCLYCLHSCMQSWSLLSIWYNNDQSTVPGISFMWNLWFGPVEECQKLRHLSLVIFSCLWGLWPLTHRCSSKNDHFFSDIHRILEPTSFIELSDIIFICLNWYIELLYKINCDHISSNCQTSVCYIIVLVAFNQRQKRLFTFSK